jgi:hypothetical protein
MFRHPRFRLTALPTVFLYAGLFTAESGESAKGARRQTSLQRKGQLVCRLGNMSKSLDYSEDRISCDGPDERLRL